MRDAGQRDRPSAARNDPARNVHGVRMVGVTAVREVARAVRILANVAAVAALGLALTFASTVPDWCDAPQRLADAACATSGGSR